MGNAWRSLHRCLEQVVRGGLEQVVRGKKRTTVDEVRPWHAAWGPPVRKEVASEASVKTDQATYSLKDPKQFAQFLEEANVRLVRAKYLAELVRTKQPFRRRQELESEAFVSNGQKQTALVTHREVQNWAAGSGYAIICSISHAWETREHPDPCRFQLQHIVNRTGLYELAFEADVWIFYDYASLFQFKRFEESEDLSFRAAMQNMHLMYAHECTLTLRIESLTPKEVWDKMQSHKVPVYYVPDLEKPLEEDRPKKEGWCKAEIEWSSLRSVNMQHQRIDQVDEPKNSDGGLKGRIPMTPKKFRQKMEEASFTHRSDAESVLRLQEKIFMEKVTVCSELVLEGLLATEILAFAQALPLFEQLHSLTLKNFRCGQEEAEAFGKARTYLIFTAQGDASMFLNSVQTFAGSCFDFRASEALASSALQTITTRNQDQDKESSRLLVQAIVLLSRAAEHCLFMFALFLD
eukprot:Skav203957  [mRNA]  locus=scaffold391:480761:492296:- [translate_table: standard]